MRAPLAMLAPALWVASLAPSGCAKEPEAPADAASVAPDVDDAVAPASPPAPAPVDPVASGLRVGEHLQPFDAFTGESGERSCPLCRLDGFPKILAAGTIGDEAFGEDLKNIDAIVAKYGEDQVKAIAVLIDAPANARAGPEPAPALPARAEQWRRQLEISMPLVVPAAGDAASSTWDTHYRVTRNRTLMLADRANQVRYSAVAPTDLAALDAAIRSAVDS